MPGEFAAIFECTYGTADFQLVDYGVEEKGQNKPGIGRVGTAATVSGEGWIEGSDPEDFEAKLAAIRAAFRVDGKPLIITGIDGITEYTLLPPQSIDGGPHVLDFRILPAGEEAPLVRRIEFKIGTELQDDDSGDGGEDGNSKYTVREATRVNSKISITYSGETRGANAYARFLATRASLRNLRPANLWPLTEEEVKNTREDLIERALTFTELVESLPAVGGNTELHDGDVTRSTELDENYGKIQTLSLDFAFTGDPIAVKDLLRPAGRLLRERWEYNTHQDRRVKASFAILSSTEDDDLIEWDNTYEALNEGQERPVYEYFGTAPRFGLKAPVYRAMQRGRAVTLFKYLKPPEPILGTAMLARPPRIVCRPLDRIRRETSWEYEYVSGTAIQVTAARLAMLNRPFKATVDPGYF